MCLYLLGCEYAHFYSAAGPKAFPRPTARLSLLVGQVVLAVLDRIYPVFSLNTNNPPVRDIGNALTQT